MTPLERRVSKLEAGMRIGPGCEDIRTYLVSAPFGMESEEACAALDIAPRPTDVLLVITRFGPEAIKASPELISTNWMAGPAASAKGTAGPC